MRQQEFAALYDEIFGGGHHKSSDDAIFEPARMSSELNERLEEALEADPALKADYSTPAEVGDRSTREFHLCAKLYAAGFSEGEIYSIMDASPQEKWHSRGDDYRIRTIRRAIEAEESAYILSVDDAREVLKGLKEKVEADPSAINKLDILQALAVLKRFEPIEYGILIDSLGLTQTVKAAVKERVQKIVNDLHAEEKKSQEEQVDPEIREEAIAILKSNDPIKYILDTLTQFHAGDQKSAELLLCSIAIGSCLNAYGTQPKLSGGSGKGKTHLCKAMRHLMPPEWILYTSLSPKALYRATDPTSPIQIKPGMVIFSDDVRIGEDMEDTLKRSMSNFQETSSYMVVQDGELRPLYLPERIIWWMTSVQDDQEEQLINRFFSVGVDESADQDKAALALTFTPLALGRREFPLDRSVQVCREILRIIKSASYVVWAPFMLQVEWQNPEERRNPGRFADLLAAYAILRIGQREVVEEGDHLKVIATVEDFESAKALYESRAENLTTKLNDDDLHMVRWLIGKAGGRPYDFTTNDLAKGYVGRNGMPLSPKTIERRLLGRREKSRTSHGLIHKIAGGALIVETKSETEELSSVKRQQRTFKQFTFDPTKYDQLGTYSKVVTLKSTSSDEKTHQTQPDPSDGSSPTAPRDSGLEEEKDNKTHKTQDMRGYKIGDMTSSCCETLKENHQPHSQDGSSGSSGSIAEDDSDPHVVFSGSGLGLDGQPQFYPPEHQLGAKRTRIREVESEYEAELCGRCGKLSIELIDLPGGSFCVPCAKELQAQEAADEVQPTSCLVCDTPIGLGHSSYSGGLCSSCGPKLPMVRAAIKAHSDGVTLSELWEDLAARGRPPRKEHLPLMLELLGCRREDGDRWVLEEARYV